jgi:hypothetical protein
MKNQSREGDVSFLVEQKWVDKWKAYLYDNDRYLNRYFALGHPPPGPIHNRPLVLEDGLTLRPGLKKNQDFRVVNLHIWRIWMYLYSADVCIPRATSDINGLPFPNFEVYNVRPPFIPE